MNCANHPQNPVNAYCRTCGKPLCSSCTRSVAGVIYCENCLAERVAGTAPPASAFEPAPTYTPAAPRGPAGSGPHPAVAGVLAGFFPFGVGSVYNGQYAKGLAHFIIFILLIVAQANTDSDTLHVVLGFGIAGFYFYQLIDAVKSARALQEGRPAPDPFGLGTMFSPGERVSLSGGVPTGAVVLIGLGVLFLLHNLGFWFLEFDRIWPVVLIALGVWLFVKRHTSPEWRYRSIAGPAILVTIGVLSLIDNLHGPGWDRTWPVILLVIGVIKLMERGYLGGGPPEPPPGVSPTMTAPPAQQPPSEVNSGVKNG
jgi:cell wall-active antibiotic response 4TMS protein YvqF/B-box zinc finger protein